MLRQTRFIDKPKRDTPKSGGIQLESTRFLPVCRARCRKRVGNQNTSWHTSRSLLFNTRQQTGRLFNGAFARISSFVIEG